MARRIHVKIATLRSLAQHHKLSHLRRGQRRADVCIPRMLPCQVNLVCDATSAICTPKVFVAWLGTDAHGAPLLSAGSVLSRFADFSLKGTFDALANEVIAMGAGLSSATFAASPPQLPPASSSTVYGFLE